MFSGSLVALVTPMKPNTQIDYESLEALVQWHMESGTDGLVILGTTGESPTILPNERSAIIRQVVKQVNGKIPVIVGAGSNSTHQTIELSKQALELGAGAVLLVTPYYNKPTQEGLFQHFKAVARAVPISQILYNVPSRTGCDLLPETIVRLSECANIVGVKEATGDINRVTQLIALGCQLDFLSGEDTTALDFIVAGGVGVISVVANVLPKQCHQLVASAISGNIEQAKKYSDELFDLSKALFVESNPIPTKWVLSQMDKIPEGIRLPLTPLSQKHQTELRKVLESIGIKIKG